MHLPDRKAWAEDFINEDFYNKIEQYNNDAADRWKQLSYSVQFSDNYQVDFGIDGEILTCREDAIFLHKSIVLDSFFYVDYIRKNTIGKIYDIGCASSVFSYVFDDIVGIDPEHPAADVVKTFNNNFIKKHNSQFPAAIAINSLHSVSFLKFKKRIIDFSECITPGGFGYITFNIAHLSMNTKESDIPEDVPNYIKSELADTSLNIINLEIFELGYWNNSLDGNIRILFRK